ncbi:MAG: CBS domain-containing protein, partial [Burkholderiaceae bacterium]|nr:CBS domain-containing protein [Burkholderiaceae bacterium]
HVPIVAEGSRLVGIITQSDLVRALAHTAQPAGD